MNNIPSRPILACLAIVALIAIAGEPWAHDIYWDWKQPDTGYPCCRGSTDTRVGDCRPTSAWKDDDGIWWVMVDGRPLKIPRHKVMAPQPDGRCHICELDRYVRCFVPCDPIS